MKQKQILDGKGNHSNESKQLDGQALRQYAAPRVVSSEALEAMAASCDPSGAGATGKTAEAGCGTPLKPLGS